MLRFNRAFAVAILILALLLLCLEIVIKPAMPHFQVDALNGILQSDSDIVREKLVAIVSHSQDRSRLLQFCAYLTIAILAVLLLRGTHSGRKVSL
jgi:hypothetical protein